MKTKQAWLLTAVALLALLGGAFSYHKLQPKLSEQVLAYPTPKPLPAFMMTDQQGQRFDNQRLQGHWSLLFIGYTFCPDVCPTTLMMLKSVYPQLAASMPSAPQVIFMSADPERDTQQRLAEYIGFFSNQFTAIFGPHQQLYPLATSMGLIYSRHEHKRSNSYLVDHSASIVLINPQGQIAATFRPQPDASGIYSVSGATLLHDLPLLAKG